MFSCSLICLFGKQKIITYNIEWNSFHFCISEFDLFTLWWKWYNYWFFIIINDRFFFLYAIFHFVILARIRTNMWWNVWKNWTVIWIKIDFGSTGRVYSDNFRIRKTHWICKWSLPGSVSKYYRVAWNKFI